MKSTHDDRILVTGAAGEIGSIGRHLTAMLLAKGHKVRAMVRREDERAESLRQLGAEVAVDAQIAQRHLFPERYPEAARADARLDDGNLLSEDTNNANPHPSGTPLKTAGASR